MPNVQLNKPGRSLKKAQAGIETTDNFIHSRYDDRYGEYDKLTKKQKALKEYQKWHDEVKKESPKSNADFIKLMKESDSLAYASNYLPELPVSEQVPLWTDPSTGKTVNKKRDMTPVDNPYTLDIAPLPWGENQEEEDLQAAIMASLNDGLIIITLIKQRLGILIELHLILIIVMHVVPTMN